MKIFPFIFRRLPVPGAGWRWWGANPIIRVVIAADASAQAPVLEVQGGTRARFASVCTRLLSLFEWYPFCEGTCTDLGGVFTDYPAVMFLWRFSSHRHTTRGHAPLGLVSNPARMGG
jgi:hypothetical protein